MAFNQPQSGWTAMSLAPNPDKFAAAHVNIDRVAQPQMQLQRSVVPALTSPVTSPAYQQLQQSIGGPTMAQSALLAQQQLASQAQATAAPANAYSAVEKQLKIEPWSKPATAATLPQSNFLSPTTGTQAKQSGWVPNPFPIV